MCENRMWPAEKLQESWIVPTNSLSCEALSDGENCNTQGENPVTGEELFTWYRIYKMSLSVFLRDLSA